jgi:RNA polymerase subunit RPABC4/transcription elongation factor Spt4
MRKVIILRHSRNGRSKMTELAKCKICKKEVSTTAPTCPNCGETLPGLHIKCPNCKSVHISMGQQGYHLGKAAAGAVIAGPVGLLGGMLGRKNTHLVCQACGKRWLPKPEDFGAKTIKEKTEETKKEAEAWKTVIKCPGCSRITSGKIKSCPKCDFPIAQEIVNIEIRDSFSSPAILVGILGSLGGLSFIMLDPIPFLSLSVISLFILITGLWLGLSSRMRREALKVKKMI